ncbi:MAG TPA: divalent-cation tolerance protein CutA [Steroidobacteraceae bacterium]|nr:divalent-cation tolerance protein CutA [Steroidobacteraceae bacterium]
MKNQYLVVFCTCPDGATADSLASALVGENLAACVSRVAGVRSTYRWEGRIHDDEEILLIIKTSAQRLATLSARIQALHPHEVPEVIAVEVAGGSERYLAWLGQTVGGS